MNRIHGTVLPLHCACMMADSETVELLLDRGAEVGGQICHNSLYGCLSKENSC